MSPRVVLVGPMGAGKSAVGALLAARLGTELRDTDADVEAAAGATVAEVFAAEGEAGFRARERLAVAAALAEHDGVLALGGGAVVDGGTRALLRRAAVPVVLLGATWAAVSGRLGDGAGRPLLGGAGPAGPADGARARWEALLAARQHLYDEVATAQVDTSGASVEDVVDRVQLLTDPRPGASSPD